MGAEDTFRRGGEIPLRQRQRSGPRSASSRPTAQGIETDQKIKRDRDGWGSVAPLGEFDQPILVKPDLQLKFETGGTDFVQDVPIGKDLIPLKSTLAVRE